MPVMNTRDLSCILLLFQVVSLFNFCHKTMKCLPTQTALNFGPPSTRMLAIATKFTQGDVHTYSEAHAGSQNRMKITRTRESQNKNVL